MMLTVFQVSVVKLIGVGVLFGMLWPVVLRTRAVGIVATFAGATEAVPRSALPIVPSRMLAPVIAPGAIRGLVIAPGAMSALPTLPPWISWPPTAFAAIKGFG